MSDKPIVLLVDDTPGNLDVLIGVLNRHYQTRIAINGPLAIKLAQMQPQPDIILLDIMMPDMDGYQVCEILKSNPATSQIPIIFVTAKISPEDEIKGLELGAADYLTKPITPAIAQQRIKTQLSLYDQKRSLYEKVLEQTKEINHSKLETIHSLGRAAEYKDNETGMHVMRMSRYCHVLALAVGMSQEDADTLRDAAPMHDVGKIGIPDSVLLKPGKLDREEWSTMQTHVEIGVSILGQYSDSKLMLMAIDVAQNHHEKWDGSGYPKGIKEQEIPITGRIAAVADVFDALTSERPYKEAWPVEKAVNLLTEERGKHFDPQIVDLFIENLDEMLDIKSQFKD
ncbi:HD domain-containing phosphohydrolase [Vibrio algarum]|uniref:Response regulator n=1 Tax=Vibrio algarum TaxID=3020714 RepID=A0ABT4YRI7_9VIBR|nr:HD domain-containing phosphohydrolase [Vibrio sp. KJ40-1]MDB1124005.1 response regulator [Vibrio sp. KJ40-1]